MTRAVFFFYSICYVFMIFLFSECSIKNYFDQQKYEVWIRAKHKRKQSYYQITFLKVLNKKIMHTCLTDSNSWLTPKMSSELMEIDVFRSDWLPLAYRKASSSVTWNKNLVRERGIKTEMKKKRNNMNFLPRQHLENRSGHEESKAAVSPWTAELLTDMHHQVKIPMSFKKGKKHRVNKVRHTCVQYHLQSLLLEPKFQTQ